jgi:uncharacterized protein (TIGR03089 family)
VTATTPDRLLAAALTRNPARPLLTFHDAATGERTELSVATFANWVAKTANLLLDEVGVAPGERLALRLPVHWQTAVWLQAAWAVGLHVDLVGDQPDLLVVTHADAADAADAGTVVSLGLAPMGLPRPGAAPKTPDALDYDRSVHAHGDRPPPPVPVPGPALTCVDGVNGAADLVAIATAAPPPPGALLVTAAPADTETVVATVLVPLVTDATAVMLRHADPTGIDDLVRQERIGAACGHTYGNLPAWRAVPG